jgi:ABC-type sugar transport system ATPase subunit
MTEADGHFLELRGVEKRFGDNHVLRGIDMDVGEHQVVSLIGGSGSGKSTLLRCINALEPVDAGTISVEGQLVSGPGVDVDAHRPDVGIVFQSFNLFPHMTVLQNITLAPRQVLKLSRKDAEARADARWSGSACSPSAGATPTASPAASSSASRSCAPWRCSPSCCWTRSPAARPRASRRGAQHHPRAGARGS